MHWREDCPQQQQKQADAAARTFPRGRPPGRYYFTKGGQCYDTRRKPNSACHDCGWATSSTSRAGRALRTAQISLCKTPTGRACDTATRPRMTTPAAATRRYRTLPRNCRKSVIVPSASSPQPPHPPRRSLPHTLHQYTTPTSTHNIRHGATCLLPYPTPAATGQHPPLVHNPRHLPP